MREPPQISPPVPGDELDYAMKVLAEEINAATAWMAEAVAIIEAAGTSNPYLLKGWLDPEQVRLAYAAFHPDTP